VFGVIIAGLRILGSFDVFDETFVDLIEMGTEIFGGRGGMFGRDFKL
jgi:hypothetical protein